MKLSNFLYAVFLVGLLAFLSLAGSGFEPITRALQSLQSDRMITVALPSDVPHSVLDDFRAAHPDVYVDIKATRGGPLYTDVGTDLEAHLADSAGYVSSADVMPVTTYNLSLEATRAGHYLDLMPLVSADPAIDRGLYHDALLQSFQWSDGQWAVPAVANFVILAYDIDAFDRANLDYPDESWQLDDLAHAARTLAQRDAAGAITRPGLLSLAYEELLLASLWQGLAPGEPLPSGNPALATSASEQLIETWARLEESGVIARQESADYLYPDVPMIIVNSNAVKDNPARDWSYLPGGHIGLVVNGFAVNGDTAHPELAYELATYLTTQVSLIDDMYLLYDVTASPDLMSQTETIGQMLPEAIQADLPGHIARTLPAGYSRLAHYLRDAVALYRNDNFSAASAMQAVDVAMQENLDLARKQREQTSLSPEVSPTLAPGQITLQFGGMDYLLDRDSEAARTLVNDFVSTHPTVGAINFYAADGSPGSTLRDYMEEADCFFLPYNVTSFYQVAEHLVPLESFMNDDVTLRDDDFLPGLLDQISYENHTYGMPVTLYPDVIFYDADQLDMLNIAAPGHDWDMSEFNILLDELGESGFQPAFHPSIRSPRYLLMLSAGYGGVPYRIGEQSSYVAPPDASSVDALRQVLDMARDGQLYYEALTEGFQSLSIQDRPLDGDNWLSLTFRRYISQTEGVDIFPTRYEILNYPSRSDAIPLSYDTGSVYISRYTPHVEACYDWVSTLAANSHLYTGMPVTYTGMERLLAAGNIDRSTQTFYQHYQTLMEAPQAVYFPILFNRFSGRIEIIAEVYWLSQAMDNYVLHNRDLQSEWQKMRSYIQRLHACSADISDGLDVSSDDSDTSGKLIQCVEDIDPELAEILNNRLSDTTN